MLSQKVLNQIFRLKSDTVMWLSLHLKFSDPKTKQSERGIDVLDFPELLCLSKISKKEVELIDERGRVFVLKVANLSENWGDIILTQPYHFPNNKGEVLNFYLSDVMEPYNKAYYDDE